MTTSSKQTPTPIERFITWIGSEASVVLHTALFIASFTVSILGYVAWDTMLLVVTTVVSLEAIYLAIFIQMTVNKNTESLREVEHDIDEIEEDLEEMHEDDDRDEERQSRQTVALESITKDIHSILADIEELKRGR